MPRRATDWVEATAACVLVVLGLVAVVGAVVMGVRVAADGLGRAHVESSRTQINAVVLVDVDVVVESREDVRAMLTGAPVRWRGGDGVERTGVARVRGPLQAGDHITAWVGQGGQLVGAPVTADEAVFIAIVAGGLFLIAVLAVLAATWCGIKRWILVRNCAGWKREWESIEPLWSGRQRWP
ncbi:MAG: hypothetical protein QOD96_7525 [Pseudonocardiales bacterium]|nr:hypothetical protein [Pseudonocardiales bacterium]